MAVILTLAFVVRLLVALRFANIIAPDEVYQYLEQAHRLVFGQGMVPWEYQVGMRNWLIPFLLAGPMEVGHWFFADPLAGLVLIRVCLCLASLGIVWCAAGSGRRFYGVGGAWVAGLCAAFWPDLWLMAPHSLQEVFAADCLVPALYLTEIRNAQGDEKRVAYAGFLLGLAFVFRLELAPAIALAGVFLCRRNDRYWHAALAAAGFPVMLSGLLDWLTWGQPFRSVWLNIDLNLFHNMAAQQFGRNPALFYIHAITLNWMWSLPVIALSCWRGAQKLPVFGWVALVILLTHTLIAHKEIRFIFPALGCFALLAAIGVARTLNAWRSKSNLNWRLSALAVLLAGPFFSPLLRSTLESGVDSFAIFESIKAETSGVVATNDYQRAYMPLDMLFIRRTLAETMNLQDIRRLRPGLILSADPGFALPGYHRRQCFDIFAIKYFDQSHGNICVWADDRAPASVPPVAMVNFYVPPVARPFEIVDRLFPDEPPSSAAP